MRKIGFDNALYMQKQTEQIRNRIAAFDNKLYLEFGGKLFDDYHAARVLPGFDPGAKVKLLQNFRDSAEIVFCINAGDIDKSKIRADFGITYDQDLMRTLVCSPSKSPPQSFSESSWSAPCLSGYSTVKKLLYKNL